MKVNNSCQAVLPHNTLCLSLGSNNWSPPHPFRLSSSKGTPEFVAVGYSIILCNLNVISFLPVF